jgi:hypothetical protein
VFGKEVVVVVSAVVVGGCVFVGTVFVRVDVGASPVVDDEPVVQAPTRATTTIGTIQRGRTRRSYLRAHQRCAAEGPHHM